MPFTVYKFEVIEGQEWIFPIDNDDYETFSAMDGRVIRDWIAPVMNWTADRTYSDFPWLSEHAPILKRPAVDALAPVLDCPYVICIWPLPFGARCGIVTVDRFIFRRPSHLQNLASRHSLEALKNCF
jgi:hypothetical protein